MNGTSMPEIVEGVSAADLRKRFRRDPDGSARDIETVAASYVEALYRKAVAPMPDPIHTYMLLIAGGELPAALFVAFEDRPALLAALNELMPEFQWHIVHYPKARLPVVNSTAKGAQTVLMRPRDMTDDQIARVFQAGRVLTPAEQMVRMKAMGLTGA